MKLINFEFTEEGKKYLPKNKDDKKGARIVLSSNSLGDSHFDCHAGLMTDYHAEMLLSRKDGKGSRFVKKKSIPQTVQKK